MNATNTDIVIVGGGVIGNSTAYHLARQRRQVLVVERSGVAVSPAASWASAGGVRRQGRHPAEAMLAIEAIERWRTLEQELEADLHYRQGGNLLLAESDTEANQLSDGQFGAEPAATLARMVLWRRRQERAEASRTGREHVFWTVAAVDPGLVAC